MDITTTTKATITFSVQYFFPTEGGMENETYGKAVDSLAKAVDLHRQACVAQPAEDWVIVGEVKYVIS